MELPMQITKTYSGNRKVVVRFVDALLRTLRKDSLSITITAPEKFEDCSVSIAIDISLVDIVETTARSYLGLRTYTSPETTQDGLSL